MSSSFEPNSESSKVPTSASLHTDGFARLARIVVYGALVIAIAAVAYAGYQAIVATSSLHESQDKMIESFEITQPAPRHLAPEYTDKDDNLLADSPSDS